MKFTSAIVTAICMAASIGAVEPQFITSTLPTTNTTNKVVDTPSQDWDNGLRGPKGITICPEPGFMNGTRVKTDICQWYATSYGEPTCKLFPFFANNAGLKPRISVFIEEGNSCLFFLNSDCRKRPEVTKYMWNGTIFNDLYVTTGDKDSTIARSYVCSMKGYTHLMTYGAQKAL